MGEGPSTFRPSTKNCTYLSDLWIRWSEHSPPSPDAHGQHRPTPRRPLGGTWGLKGSGRTRHTQAPGLGRVYEHSLSTTGGPAPPAPLLPVRATPKPTCQDDSVPVPRGLACPPEGSPVSPLSSAVVCNLPCLQHQEPSPPPWRGLHPGLLRAELVGAPGRCLPKGEGGEFLCVRKKKYMTPRPSQGQRCPTTLPGHPGTDGRLGRRLGSTCYVVIQVLQGTNPDTCP